MIRLTKIIGPLDDPYMRRWFLFKFRNWPRIYVHKFYRSDDDRGLHDHPWWFVSIILWGKYLEILPGRHEIRRPLSIQFRRATDTHRVVLFSDDGVTPKPVWTLFIAGRVVRQWGFWCDDYVTTMNSGQPEKYRVGSHFVPWPEFEGCE